ncbi:hypothetical protein B0H16DRAFT_1607183 [Mycena metata]|uniref:Secreted protein n=1 Tax=Mycena metata TaxID=1033252 RepID=A0AAD7MJ67_9AGAR|nr:hypothetical protein B0H16DRAFT_1607183 [Mycena metata]
MHLRPNSTILSIFWWFLSGTDFTTPSYLITEYGATFWDGMGSTILFLIPVRRQHLAREHARPPLRHQLHLPTHEHEHELGIYLLSLLV